MKCAVISKERAERYKKEEQKRKHYIEVLLKKQNYYDEEELFYMSFGKLEKLYNMYL